MFKNKYAPLKEALDAIVQRLFPQLSGSEDSIYRAGERIEQLLYAESALKAAMKELNADSTQQLYDFIVQAIEERNAGLFLSFDEYDRYEEISQWLKQELGDSGLDLQHVYEAFRPIEHAVPSHRQCSTQLQELAERYTLEINQLRYKLAYVKTLLQTYQKDRTDELKSTLYEQQIENLQHKNAELTKDCTKLLNQLYTYQYRISEYSSLYLAFQAAMGREYEYEEAMRWLACTKQQTQSESAAERILLKISAILQILPAQKDFEEQVLSWVELSAQMQQSGLFVGEEQLYRMQYRAIERNACYQTEEQPELAELRYSSQLLVVQLDKQVEQTMFAYEKVATMTNEQMKLQNLVEEQQAALFQKEYMISALIAAQNEPRTQSSSVEVETAASNYKTQQSMALLEARLAELYKASAEQRQKLALAACKEARMLYYLQVLEEDRNQKAWALEEQESALDAIKYAVAELGAKAAEIRAKQEESAQIKAKLLDMAGTKSIEEAFARISELSKQRATPADHTQSDAEQDIARLCKALQIKPQKTIGAAIGAYSAKTQSESARQQQTEAQLRREAAASKQREKEAQQVIQSLEAQISYKRAAGADLERQLLSVSGGRQRLQDEAAAQRAQLAGLQAAAMRRDREFGALLLAREDIISGHARALAQLGQKLRLCELDMTESGDRLLALQGQTLEVQNARDQLAAVMEKREEERNQLLYRLSTLVRAERKWRSEAEALENECRRLQESAEITRGREQAFSGVRAHVISLKQSVAALKAETAAFNAQLDVYQIASCLCRLLAAAEERINGLSAELAASHERTQQLQGQRAEKQGKAQQAQIKHYRREHDEVAALRAENARLAGQIQQKTQLNSSLRAEIGAIEQTFEDTVSQYQRVAQENAALSGAFHALRTDTQAAAAGFPVVLAASEQRASQRIAYLAGRLSLLNEAASRANERRAAPSSITAVADRYIAQLQRQNAQIEQESAELREDRRRLTETAVLLQQQISQFEMVIRGYNAVIDDLRDLSAQQNAQLACLAQENDGARQTNHTGEAVAYGAAPLQIAAQLVDSCHRAAAEAKRALLRAKEDAYRFSEAAGRLAAALADWTVGCFNGAGCAVAKEGACGYPEQHVFGALAAWLDGYRLKSEAVAVRTLQSARLSALRYSALVLQQKYCVERALENHIGVLEGQICTLEAQNNALEGQAGSLNEENFALLQHALDQEKHIAQCRVEAAGLQCENDRTRALLKAASTHTSDIQEANFQTAAVLDLCGRASALRLEQDGLFAAVGCLQNSLPALVALHLKTERSAVQESKYGVTEASAASTALSAPNKADNQALEVENAWLKTYLAALEELTEDNARELAALKMQLARVY